MRGYRVWVAGWISDLGTKGNGVIGTYDMNTSFPPSSALSFSQ